MKDSPTCNHDSMQILVMVFASKGRLSKSIDITAAFLQGDCSIVAFGDSSFANRPDGS